MNNMKLKTVVFFGRSGSGKGTQAKLLTEYIQNNDPENREVIYIETGERFREFVNTSDTLTSRLTGEVMSMGGLMPEFIPIWVWTDYLVKNYTGKEHLVLDGLSRRADEAPIFDSALRFYRRENSQVIFLNTSREWSIERLKERGREDDTEEDIHRRLDWFEENTMPALNYFKSHVGYDFIEIDGEQSIEKVHADIISRVFRSNDEQ